MTPGRTVRAIVSFSPWTREGQPGTVTSMVRRVKSTTQNSRVPPEKATIRCWSILARRSEGESTSTMRGGE